MAVVYGRVKLKFKSSKAAEPSHSPSEPKAPADAGKSQAAAPETGKQGTAEKGVVAPLDTQATDGQGLELTGSDKEKVGKKVGVIKLLSAGLPHSAQDVAQDREADEVVEPLPSKQETVLVNDESDNASEPRNSQESEVKQSSTPDRQRDDKELAAALEVSTTWLSFTGGLLVS
jgi:hypothetical protein